MSSIEPMKTTFTSMWGISSIRGRGSPVIRQKIGAEVAMEGTAIPTWSS